MSGFEQLPFDGGAPDALPEEEAAPTPGADEPPEAIEPLGDPPPPEPDERPTRRGAHAAPSPATEVPAPAPARAPASNRFQASAGIQGRQFAEQCDTLLAHYGYELKGRRVLTEVGVEIDQEAVSPTGATVWFEYKGSVQGNRPGLRRTDTLKKAIANGALLRSLDDPAPYVVITSHLPEAGSGAAMLGAALQLKYFADVVCLYDPKDTGRLNRW